MSAPLDVMPMTVSDVELAFPAHVGHLMPAYDDIPDEYKNGHTWANRMAADWFFFGLKGFSIPWKDGIDPKAALRHLGAILGSYEPQHEHKEAAVAYLLDSWTDGEPSWTRAKG